MNSIVHFLNSARGMFSVLLETGEYTVIELLDSNEITIGDEVAGELESVGSRELKNVTSGETLSVMIQNVHCNEQQAKNGTLLK